MYPLDPVIAAGMIFSIICLILVGGFILLFPIARRVGDALQIWIEEHQSAERAGELREVHRAMKRLSSRLETLERKHAFVEELVAGDAEQGAGVLGSGEEENVGSAG